MTHIDWYPYPEEKPKEIKRFVLLKSGCLFMERFQIKTDHVDEFIDRYAETIIVAWGS